MDFGKDLLLKEIIKGKESLYTQGEWHFWIYMCAWRIDQNEEPLIGANDDRKDIVKKLKFLENKKLLDVSILNAAFDTLFVFENRISLHLFSFNTLEDEQWMLFTPDKKVFTAGPGKNWSYENSQRGEL